MKNINFIVFGLCTLFFSCMDYYDGRNLVINNKSNKSIYSIISKNEEMSNSSFYDEFKEYVSFRGDHFVFREIKPDMKAENHDRPRDWNSFFKTTDKGELRLFIISKDSVDKYGWNKIFKCKIYNKKYKLSINDLEYVNWEIIYN